MLLGLTLLVGGCPAHLQTACPSCVAIAPDRTPRVAPGVRRVYVLVPGILGYGWEWAGAQIALQKDPQGQVVVADWDPWQSLARGGARIGTEIDRLLGRLPGTVAQVTVLAHSVGGMVAVLGAAGLHVPPGLQVQVVTVGTPFAGTHLDLFDFQDSLQTPVPFAMGGTFSGWPAPALGVTLTVYPTLGPRDPVMRRWLGHDPGDLRVLPQGARVCALPREIDHNAGVAWVAGQVVAGRIGPPIAAAIDPGAACVLIAAAGPAR